jgi:hypothetical protein
VYLSDILQDTLKLTANDGNPYVVRMSPTKVLSAFQPSTEAAPFNIPTAANPIIGDIEVEEAGDRYANRVIVKVASQVEQGRTESFDGDGSTSTFTLTYTPTSTRGYVTNDGVYETLTDTTALAAGGDPATWTYDVENNTITRNGGAPASGTDNISMVFDGVYNGLGDASDASWATAPWERIITLEKVPDDTTAQEFATARLAEFLVRPKTITYKTRNGAGLKVGQSQHITFALRNLNTDVIITEIVARDYGENALKLLRQVTAVTGVHVPENRWDTYKTWASDMVGEGGAQNITAGSGIPGQSGPAPPVTSVQFNDNQRFGGNAAFTFDKGNTSVYIGTGHSAIGAANLLVGESHTVGS